MEKIYIIPTIECSQLNSYSPSIEGIGSSVIDGVVGGVTGGIVGGIVADMFPGPAIPG